MPRSHHHLLLNCGLFLALLLITLLAATVTVALPPRSPPGTLNAVQQMPGQQQGLYNSSDDVLILTAATFRPHVFASAAGHVVEFYNTFCGHCRRFAPHWKRFARDIRDWRPVVRVAAIDCAADINSQLCRDYEVMGYPTIRYFGPHFADAKHYGDDLVQTEEPDALRSRLLTAMRAFNATAHSAGQLSPAVAQLVAGDRPLAAVWRAPQTPADARLVFVVYESTDEWLANELALDVHAVPHVHVERVHSAAVAATYVMRAEVRSVAVVLRDMPETAVPLSMAGSPWTREALRSAVQRFAQERGLVAPVTTTTTTTTPELVELASVAGRQSAATPGETDAVVAYVRAHEPTVYRADIEHAVWYALGHEVAQIAVIEGERLEALRRFVAVLHRYAPLSGSGSALLGDLSAYASSSAVVGERLRGEHFDAELRRLRRKWRIGDSSESSAAAGLRWIGCQGSQPNRRGYTCGLWTLFHFLTVRADQLRLEPAAANEAKAGTNTDDTLRAIHGYVKYFFGCTDCAQHFQQMAERRRLGEVRSATEAVVWLWRAHNEVNARLAGDAVTEDAAFPKVAWPTVRTCAKCRTGGSGSGSNATSVGDWVDAEVLQHLRAVYAAANLSEYGMPAAAAAASSSPLMVSPPMALVQRERDAIVGDDGMFSDLDMRMGIMLYVFCVAMLLVAVKLFLRQRYIRKGSSKYSTTSSAHDYRV